MHDHSVCDNAETLCPNFFHRTNDLYVDNKVLIGKDMTQPLFDPTSLVVNVIVSLVPECNKERERELNMLKSWYKKHCNKFIIRVSTEYAPHITSMKYA